ncbi:WYL domain-containing protein [Streptomyces albus]|uniref:helix-turn-helix transcriptional regulator n=1 Tax=Streptomyces albus TaxID=1888 RepID=UPI0024AE2DF6|nr:WYL domain-containing protein [Streptomyces albus]MDI6411983.1 WYL domain-containing protein [Streptomyces albus]
MKSDRLLSVLLLLQTRGRITADRLAAELEVSRRTIYRDVEALSAAGVPVYAERGRSGGIRLLPGYRTDVTGLTSDEARALFVLATQGAHQALGLDGALGTALRKVMAALPAPHRPAAELTSRRILVDPDRWLSGPRADVRLDELHTAVFTDRRLRLRYRHGGEGPARTYTVDPYGLVSKAGVWYLVADRRRSPALFRVDRVVTASVVDEAVRRRPGVELAEVWGVLRRRVEERPARIRVTARVHRSRYGMFTRIVGPMLAETPQSGPQSGPQTGPDGTEEAAEGRGKTGEAGAAEAGERTVEGEAADEWVTVRLDYPVLPAVGQLLQFGPWVEVVDPPCARAELVRRAREVLDVYGASPSDGPDGDTPAPVLPQRAPGAPGGT